MEKSLYRIWRHPGSDFGIACQFSDELKDETVTADDVYTDTVLNGIAADGFNAIWVHGQLHHLVGSDIFPEFGKNSTMHLEKMRDLIRRAARYGIKVLIYLQPPRAIAVSDTVFWEKHADVGGQVVETQGDDGNCFKTRSLCTSQPKVLNYISTAFAALSSALPELGGYIIISASEYPAHCYSRRNCRPGISRPRKMIMDQVPVDCPNCAKVEPEEIIVSLIWSIRNGIRSVSNDLELILWNWSWSMYVDSPCAEIIERLPADCSLLIDFERGGMRNDGCFVNEYSLGYSGPSEQFLQTWTLSRTKGMRVMAKLQLGTTHELATVVSLPCMNNIFRKADFIKKNCIDGFMGCWNFGNHTSANTAGFNYFLSASCPDGEADALKAFAAKYFSGCIPENVAAAWTKFTEALGYYPFSVPFLYHSPLNYTMAFVLEPGPLTGRAAGRSWLMDDRGDDLSQSITEQYPLDDIIARLETIGSLWRDGIALLRAGLRKVITREAEDELGNAEVCAAVWRSAVNTYKIYQLRKVWNQRMLNKYFELIKSEVSILENVLYYMERDKRQGFHVEAGGYMFSPEMVRRKIEKLNKQIEGIDCTYGNAGTKKQKMESITLTKETSNESNKESQHIYTH